MARVLKVSHFYGMNHTCLCLPSQSWYSFTDPGGIVMAMSVIDLGQMSALSIGEATGLIS